MQIFLRFLKWFGILLAILVVIGFFLPKNSHIERSVVINTQPMDAYSLVNHLPNWERWSPWYEQELTAVRKYSSPASGNGAWFTWEGDVTGSGKVTLEKVKATSRIDTKISFAGQGDAEADFIFEKLADKQVRVTWMFDAEHGMNPLSRWSGLFMDTFLGEDYEQGLANLKREAEIQGSKSKKQ